MRLEATDGGGDDLADGFAVPATHRRVWDFSADGVRRTLEASLERLGLDRVDVVYLHDPDEHAEQAFREGYPALEKLRAEGVVGAIGAGMNQAEMLTRFVRDTDVDVVLCAGRYTLLDQRAGCRSCCPPPSRVACRWSSGAPSTPVCWPTPGPGPPSTTRGQPAGLLDRALRMKETAERHGITLRAAALAFCAAHPAVASVLVGTRSAAEVRDCAEQFTTQVPAAFWQELRDTGLLPPEEPS